MTACTRAVTNDVGEDVAVRKIEDAKDIENVDVNVDVDVATNIWKGGYRHTHGNCGHLGSACRNPGLTHKNEATLENMMERSKLRCYWINH